MSLIIPLALKSISTVVPPVILDGTISGLFVDNTTTFIYGSFTEITGITRWRLAGIDNNGALTSFFSGKPNPGYQSTAALMKTPSGQNTVLAKYNGSLTQFDTTDGSVVSAGPAYAGVDLINDLFVDPYITNSEVFAAGLFSKIGSTARSGLAKFKNNLSFDSSWSCNPYPTGTIYSICSAPNFPSHIYVGGSFTSIEGNTTKRKVARITKTGAGVVDTTFTFSYNTCSTVFSLSPSSNGYIFVAGSSTVNRPFIKCITSSGTDFLNLSGNIQQPWSNYFSYCSEIKVNEAENKIYAFVTGSSAFSGTTVVGYLHRFNYDGTLDTSFNNPNGYISFARFNGTPTCRIDFNNVDNRISIGGAFDWVSGTNKTNFTILNNNGSIFF